ncbi:sigma-70 family RNA polymerase sigma factor [Lysinibacillus sp. NPDC093712]|uniref:sigma-70 family RNA polymerase sigma factor n=1 Tax=Lysinibacillus sp. NPDC093712 TaxID=3390579 RepID=UPI003CFD8041
MDIKIFLINFERKKMDPVILFFLQDQKNRDLLSSFLAEPCLENKVRLDNAFKVHYKKAKVISYINKLIHYYSIDFDKKVNRYYRRNIFLSSFVKDENNAQEFPSKQLELQKDLYDTVLNNQGLLQSISSEELLHAIKTLSSKQLLILDLKYSQNLSNKEIAHILNESPQTISYNLRTAIKKLRAKLFNNGCGKIAK